MSAVPANIALTVAFRTRMGFVTELARRLHQYGTTASRLEDAVSGAAQRLGMRAEVWSSPTAIILSFADQAQGDDSIAQVTEVIRLAPGDVNLARLCEADAIADGVTDGRVGIEEGARQLRALSVPLSAAQKRGMVFGYGMSAAGFAALMRTSWADIAVAGVVGFLTGMVVLATSRRPRLAPATEAISAIVATLVIVLSSVWIWPLDINLVVLTAVIVLVPGMALTTAVRELSTQHLASGVARLFGGLAGMLKLIFGVVAVIQICAWFGVSPPPAPHMHMPGWVEWLALIIGSFGFALVFLAARRDWLLVALAAMVGYLASRIAGAEFGPGFGVFVGGLVLGALSNVYARFVHRPGTLIREPGIILLVPGSVGFQTLANLADRHVDTGIQTAILLITLLVALVAGLLFGDLLVAPRRSL
ncbi:MAG TPA: threonine/serine exporter family protein [Oleiagrimonas sp.]|nr:threonine/serine exporter family protein [Oleiagrimonas sp.]